MKYNKNEIIGRMRDRITIQNVTRSKSDTGFAQESWADSAIVWANAESKLPPSNETVIDGKNTAKNISDFTIRYTTGIDEESRIIWNDKLYQVRNIKVSHDRRFISFQGEFYDSYILTGVTVASILSANASLSSNVKVIHNVLAAMNAIATTNAEIVVSQQGQVLLDSSLSASGNVSADATKVIPINSDVTANGTLAAAVTKAINIDSTLNANATLVGDALVSKTLSSTLNANATTSAAVDVVTQGLVSVDAALTGLGTVSADIFRTVTLESSSSTSATTELNATLTKVIEASMNAAAITESAAQLTIAVNAETNAIATTSADATLSYTVNAELNATAQTTVDAKITRIISAEMTATAQTTVEAGIGVTFVSSLMAAGSVTNAELFRTATLESFLTANGTTTSAITTAKNISASVSGAATVTNSNLQLFDPNFSSVQLLLHGNGTNGSTTFTDNSNNNFSLTRGGNTVISTAQSKFGGASILFDGAGDYLQIPNNSNLTLGTGDFTIEFWIYPLSQPGSFNTIIGGDATNEPIVNLRGSVTSIGISMNVFGSADIFNESFTFTQNNWYHVAISRSGTSLKVYVNGNQIGSTITNSTNISAPITCVGGLISYAQNFNGYIDDVRITKGVARYTGSTLTVPTREFLDQ
jgi:SPP1 family predicted phage head-tail adaptor